MMRVIAGDLKGRRLYSVAGKQTRPTSDKVKEAVFQMIGPFFTGGDGLDLFAGSGALGIEAISRGLDHVVFIDKHFPAIKTIKRNLETLKILDRADVHKMDAYQAIRMFRQRQEQFQFIFIDPPYKQVHYETIIEQIIKNDILETHGIIYCEHDHTKDIQSVPDQLQCIKQAVYGKTTAISIFQKQR